MPWVEVEVNEVNVRYEVKISEHEESSTETRYSPRGTSFCLSLQRNCRVSSGLSLDVTSLWSTRPFPSLSNLEILTFGGCETFMEVGVSKIASAAITLPSIYSN